MDLKSLKVLVLRRIERAGGGDAEISVRGLAAALGWRAEKVAEGMREIRVTGYRIEFAPDDPDRARLVRETP